MFIGFVEALRRGGIPASLKEHLLLLEAMDAEVIGAEPEQFYYLARATFVHAGDRDQCGANRRYRICGGRRAMADLHLFRGAGSD